LSAERRIRNTFNTSAKRVARCQVSQEHRLDAIACQTRRSQFRNEFRYRKLSPGDRPSSIPSNCRPANLASTFATTERRILFALRASEVPSRCLTEAISKIETVDCGDLVHFGERYRKLRTKML
jgi:hypothetical protein